MITHDCKSEFFPTRIKIEQLQSEKWVIGDSEIWFSTIKYCSYCGKKLGEELK